MMPFRANRLTIAFIAIFFLCIFGYTYFEARNVLRGPTIELSGQEQQIVVHAPLVMVQGTASNITELRMDGRIIPTTEAGAFEEAHLLATGYNAIVLSARDKIGRTTEKVIQLVYEPVEAATSTAQLPNFK